MKRKSVLILATIGLLATIGTCFGVSWLYSEPEQVTINYNLTMSHSVNGLDVTLTAYLFDGSTPLVGETIEFWKCQYDGTLMDGSAIATNTTDANGECTAVWTAPTSEPATYYFVVRTDLDLL